MSETGKCTGCGLCAKVCGKAITLENGRPVFDLSKCNACGHCVGVCPNDAIDHPRSPRQELVGKILTPDEAARFLRTARSVRFYKEKSIDHMTMEKLLDIGRYAQTGSNSQGISYIVVDGREKVVKMLDLFCDIYESAAPNDPSLAWLEPAVTNYRKSGKDGILRGAPQVILALADKGDHRGPRNAQFDLTFIALLAPSMGLGTCWAGIFERLICDGKYDAPFRKMLNIPDNLAVQGAMMVGYPDVTFRRLVARNDLNLTWF